MTAVFGIYYTTIIILLPLLPLLQRYTRIRTMRPRGVGVGIEVTRINSRRVLVVRPGFGQTSRI